MCVRVWPPLLDHQARTMEAMAMRDWRRITDQTQNNNLEPGKLLMTDEQIRLQLKVPTVETRMAAERLRYAARLSTHGQETTMAFVQGVGGQPWRSMLLHDIAWLQRALAPKLEALPFPGLDPRAWEAFWRKWPKVWSQLIVKSLEVVAQHPHRYQPAVKSEPASVSAVAARAVDGEHMCHICWDVFPTVRSLNAHRTIKHKHRAEHQFYVRDSVCPVCGTEFHMRVRAMSHFTLTKCREAMATGQIERFSL